MIYIAAALYYEASPFIDILGLKKDMFSKHFQVFKNEDVTLIVTGTDSVSCSAAVTYMLTFYNIKNDDLFFNIGICGAASHEIKKGSIMLINKIVSHDSGKAFYPEILIKHPFFEGSIETFSKVVTSLDSMHEDLIDMEAYGAFKAASVFLPLQNIYILKIVSDYIDTSSISKNDVTQYMAGSAPIIINFMDDIKKVFPRRKDMFSQNEYSLLNDIAVNLKLSECMKTEFNKLSKQYKIRHGNIDQILEPYLKIICKSKNEGKIYFAKLKSKLNEL